MIKTFISSLSLLALGLSALALTSCSGGCCTGEDPVPPLRPLPNFAQPVTYGK